MKNIQLQTKGKYTLLARVKDDGELHEYCVAFGYDKQVDTWGYGSYFSSLECAIAHMEKKTTNKFDSINAIAIDSEGNPLYLSMVTLLFTKVYSYGYDLTVYVDCDDTEKAKKIALEYTHKQNLKIDDFEATSLL